MNRPAWVHPGHSFEAEALYLHPANDGLMKAAEHLLAILDANWEDITEVQNLRAELNKDKS